MGPRIIDLILQITKGRALSRYDIATELSQKKLALWKTADGKKTDKPNVESLRILLIYMHEKGLLVRGGHPRSYTWIAA